MSNKIIDINNYRPCFTIINKDGEEKRIPYNSNHLLELANSPLASVTSDDEQCIKIIIKKWVEMVNEEFNQ